MDDEQENTAVFAEAEAEHKFPKIIHVKGTQKTDCHFNPNSRYQLSSPPLQLVDSLTAPAIEDDFNRLDDKEEHEIIIIDESGNNDRTSLERPSERVMPAQSEAAIIGSNTSTTTDDENERYNPSKVFLSWMNEGTTPRPVTSSTKIRLTYSGSSLSDTTRINPITDVSSTDVYPSGNDTSRFFDNENGDEIPCRTSSSVFWKASHSSSGNSLSSTISATVSTIFNRSTVTRRYSRYFFNNNNDDDIPLVEMQNDTNEVPGVEKMRKRYGPELV